MLPAQEVSEKTRILPRVMSCTVAFAVFVSCVLFLYPQAFASFSSESVEQVIGVGRIQSSTALATSQLSGATHFEAPEQLTVEPTQAMSQLAQPLERSVENVESAIADINLIQRFGEPDAAGWYTTISSAYGPSSAGQFTALGTELTLTSMDIGVHHLHADVLLGRYVELMYNGKILRCKVVDTGMGGISDSRLFDLQPGVCTYFGAETPEFGWDLRTIQWRFAD